MVAKAGEEEEEEEEDWKRRAAPVLPLSEMHSTEKNIVAAKSAPQPHS